MNFKMNNFKLLFFLLLILSTLMVMSTNSWINAWMSMEINLMSFIPLIKNNKSSKSMMLYFIVQAMASSLMLFMMIMMKIELNYLKMTMMFSLIQLSILMKMGAAPLYWWTPKILLKLNWKTSFLFLTWQKIAPLILLNSSLNNNMMIYISMILSIISGAILGLNQTLIKLILIYSSINHMGWMLMSLNINSSVMWKYFIIYLLMNLLICTFMNNFKINQLNELFKNNNQNTFIKMILLTSFLSLSGMPPFIGFLPKMMVLIIMINNKLFMESLLFIMMTILTLLFYMNPLLSMFLMLKTNSKLIFKNMTINNMLFSLLILNLMMSLIMMPFILNLN